MIIALSIATILSIMGVQLIRSHYSPHLPYKKTVYLGEDNPLSSSNYAEMVCFGKDRNEKEFIESTFLDCFIFFENFNQSNYLRYGSSSLRNYRTDPDHFEIREFIATEQIKKDPRVYRIIVGPIGPVGLNEEEIILNFTSKVSNVEDFQIKPMIIYEGMTREQSENKEQQKISLIFGFITVSIFSSISAAESLKNLFKR